MLCVSMYIHFYCTVAPTVINPIANKMIRAIEDNSVTLNFEIMNANPPVSANQIKWHLNDSLLLNFETIVYGNTLAFSTDYSELTISNLNYDIAGRISFNAHNLVGSSSDYVDLIIEG